MSVFRIGCEKMLPNVCSALEGCILVYHSSVELNKCFLSALALEDAGRNDSLVSTLGALLH